ncbi:helix-turn-helix transcriptional regulator [Streptomyces sp. ASQP_92]|uniref:response regulator transcription factor n=1 Tax=Streptomyces sp. ASQP_92 TaxID=2979116 RepID=UPI0021C23409|nr:helix-turn-helix transcriptional regulator [Streptomyces sp. ASQP_92]MCT9092901.1 helix-turn-helix transcriptional regulator [Streptomyces sp. ASQP_92]
MTTLPPPRVGAPLSARELAVLEGIARGLPNARIAVELGLSTGTVATHIRRLLAKLGARDKAHGVGNAFRLGILGGPVIRPRGWAA